MAVPPTHVVRFYGNTDYAMMTIGFREIAFVHIDQLNDPFDPHVFFTTDFHDDYTALIDYVQQYHKEDLQNFSARLPRENWEEYLGKIAERFNSLRNGTFIFSTCAVSEQKHPKDNLFMWSHYGNGHRSIAIEFDTALLTRAVSTKSKMLGGEETQIDEVWNEINYTPMLPKITCESIYEAVMCATEKFNLDTWRHTNFYEIMLLMLRSKSLVWSVEDEWRLMWHNDETNLKIQRLNLLDNTITALYLGCLVTNHLRDSLVSQMKRSFPNAVIYGSKKVKGAFALEFKVL
jgi:DUF2971 family protein